MNKFLSILYFFSLVLTIQGTSFAQDKLSNTQNPKKIVLNKKYGFKFEYQGKLIQKNKNEYVIQINKSNQQDLVYIKVDSEPSVYLPGTYGGWFYFNSKKSGQTLSDIVATKRDTINEIAFTTNYWLVYGGEGSWDATINSYTKYKNRFYVFSLVHEFLKGNPDVIINNKKQTKQKLLNKGLSRMEDKKNVYVKRYNEILSSFSFSKDNK